MIKRILSALLPTIGLGALAGRPSPTVITLNDGREIRVVDTPFYDEDPGLYEFEQPDGKHARVDKDQTRTVKEL